MLKCFHWTPKEDNQNKLRFNDWYKFYVTIISQFDVCMVSKPSGNAIPFVHWKTDNEGYLKCKTCMLRMTLILTKSQNSNGKSIYVYG